jgi:hypothetical protein
MSSTPNQPGILLGRHDGVIVVLDDLPVPVGLAAELDSTLAALGLLPARPPATEDTDPTT